MRKTMWHLNIKNMSSLVFSIILIIICSSYSFAAGGSEEGHSNVLMGYVWAIINFLILVGLLVFMMKKMDIKGYFRKRTELIEQSLREAKEAKELAQKALAEVEERLKLKDKEIDEIMAAARESGEREKARLIEEGDRMKSRIIEQAKTNIDFELKRAKETIKQEAVDIAMELAEKKLKEKLTKEEQMRLLEESIVKIEDKN